jgi:predicted nucleic acid-binding protein
MPHAAEPYSSGVPTVFYTSAWNRRTDADAFVRWAPTRDAGLLAVCPVVALELLAAARDEDASRELAGDRRLPATDYLIAAAAAERGFGVLHYDRHFEPLCRALGIESVLVAPRGPLD